MKTLAASAAKENFGALLDMVQSEPVRLQDRGRDVAVVLSPAEFRRLSETVRGFAKPAIEPLEREALIRQAQEASRALKDDPRERALLDEPEGMQARNADAQGDVNPAVERLHAESTGRWAEVYKALAK